MSNRVIVDAMALNALCEQAAQHMSLRDLVGQVRTSVTSVPKPKVKPKSEPEPVVTLQSDEPI